MHLAVIAVDDDGIVIFSEGDDACRLPDDRNAHGTRHDDDMARHRAVFEHETAQFLTRIIQEFGGTHGAGKHDGVEREILLGTTPAKTDELAQQPVGEIVEIMHAFAQVRIGQAHHARLGVALHLFDSRFRRQAVADRLFHAAYPALIVGKHAIGFENFAMFSLCRHVTALQHVVDRQA
ncbi:hypothetical protein D3C72_1046400 [compost metagenome]